MRRARLGLWLAAVSLGLALGCDRTPLGVPVDTGVVWTRLTDPSATPTRPIHHFPDWRGNSLVLSLGTSNFASWRLATVPSDGTGTLTFHGLIGRSADIYPRWINDTLIVFASDQRSVGDLDLWIRSTGSDTLSPRQITNYIGDELSPTPRPGTPGLVYVQATSNIHGQLALLPDTAFVPLERIYLTPDTLKAGEPHWDSSGQRLCFSVIGSDGVTRHLFVISMADTIPRQITTGPYRDEDPRWSPDGSRILFSSNRTGRSGLWTVDPAGEAFGLTLIAFADPGATLETPAWSPDGSKIAVSMTGPGLSRALWILSNLP